ncbi:uncharacterized protein LOC119571987, partial [Penaeus monodon]|uniref:uncharacterized protein LOC119571987 n=1 Tax=Penaeus monodon TaxID=6687 RepID=UPI0018A76B10
GLADLRRGAPVVGRVLGSQSHQSHPALYLYQGNNTPPPPVQPIPRPLPIVPTVVILNDTVISNTTTLGSGMPDGAGSEGTAPRLAMVMQDPINPIKALVKMKRRRCYDRVGRK